MDVSKLVVGTRLWWRDGGRGTRYPAQVVALLGRGKFEGAGYLEGGPGLVELLEIETLEGPGQVSKSFSTPADWCTPRDQEVFVKPEDAPTLMRRESKLRS